jgi:hypothetical protein
MKPKGIRQRALINPIELVVFTGSVVIFAISAYRFFTDAAQLDKIAQISAELPVAGVGADRKPASFVEKFSEVKLSCNELDHPVQTGASKVRLVLSACPKGLKNIKIEHTQNRAPATVFYDGNGLSTDYVSIQSGENVLKVQATTSNNTVWTQEVKIIRN